MRDMLLPVKATREVLDQMVLNSRADLSYEQAEQVYEALSEIGAPARPAHEWVADMEQIGEMAEVCVFGITKRVCPYCRCERSEADLGLSGPASPSRWGNNPLGHGDFEEGK